MRKIERHPSNQGSVITFDMYGKEVQLFVADAKYRIDNKMWCDYKLCMPEFSIIMPNGSYINPSAHDDNNSKPLSYTMTDKQLQERFPVFKRDKTAKENTDILMRYACTYAARWCRSQNISGVGQMDLPNIYELMVIYLESDRIDALDPTVNEYKQYALGMVNLRGRFNLHFGLCWSSTGWPDESVYCVTDYGFVGCATMNTGHSVIPVKELSIEEYKNPVNTRNKTSNSHKRHNKNVKIIVIKA